MSRARRPEKDEYFLKLAQLVATRATCRRRQVGAVLVNARGHVLATGYNGTASGLPHCLDEPCPGVGLPSGEGLDQCQAIHAEQNALLQCQDAYGVSTCYVTASPCATCTKLLLNTTCQRIVFLEEYPDERAKELWRRASRTWERHFLA